MSLVIEKVAHETEVLRFGDLTLDTLSGELCKGGVPVKIAPMVTRIAELLMRANGEPLSTRALNKAIYGFVPRSNAVGQYVRCLRRALGPAREGEAFIHTQLVIGYSLRIRRDRPDAGTQETEP